jgi:type VI secretion system protein ImpA
MLSTATVEELLNPISESLPSGDDLEYDPAYMALEAAAQPKAEQQFGDTVIAAVEPEWRSLIGDATGLLRRSKDLRIAVLGLRAATRTQGIQGVALGLTLINELTEKFWDTVHPQLDADDALDPTMRLNALAPMSDTSMVLRDVYDCLIGTSRNVGPIRVRDVAIAQGKLAATSADPSYSASQIEGGLQDIHTADPTLLEAVINTAALVQKLQSLIAEKTGRVDEPDLKPLRSITYLLRQTYEAATGSAAPEDGATTGDNGTAEAGAGGSVRGEIKTRQDALLMLDKVITFLERTEPGNPAPLLIKRAKRLVGVSFMDIMADLAPDSVNSIQIVTGKSQDS